MNNARQVPLQHLSNHGGKVGGELIYTNHLWTLAGEQLVKNRRQAPEVATFINAGTITTLLRRHEVDRPQGRTGLRLAMICRGLTGQAEIAELGDSCRGHENIGGLDIAMGNTQIVGDTQAVTHLADNVNGFFQSQ